MSIEDIPTTIAPDEYLGRRISSRRDANRMQRANKIPYNYFMPKKGDVRLSVDRLAIAPLGKISEIAADTILRTSGNQFRGWAVVSADTAAASERSVAASPIPGNPYHADIILPADTANNRIAQKNHAADMARLASWRASALLA